jgi:hypothetical protein
MRNFVPRMPVLPRTPRDASRLLRSLMAAISQRWWHAPSVEEIPSRERHVERSIFMKGGQASTCRCPRRRMQNEQTKPTLDSHVQYSVSTTRRGRIETEQTKPTLDNHIQYSQPLLPRTRVQNEQTKPTLDKNIRYSGPNCGCRRVQNEQMKPTLDSDVQYSSSRYGSRRVQNEQTKPTLDKDVQYSASNLLRRRTPVEQTNPIQTEIQSTCMDHLTDGTSNRYESSKPHLAPRLSDYPILLNQLVVTQGS